MGRTRLGGKPSNKNGIALEFKKRPKSTSRLFGKELNSTLSKGEQDYFIVVDALQGKKVEPTLKQVGAFFAQQYRFIFNCDCIDYNWFNFQNTMKRLKDYAECKSWIEVALFIYSSFEQCLDRTFSKEELITLSTFKRSWLVDELKGKKQKFSGFY